MTTIVDDKPVEKAPSRDGHDALQLWFGLSYAAWLTLPRVMMQAMPDDWQRDMARLLVEWDNTWRGDAADIVAATRVQRVGSGGRLEAWPEWVKNYRRPDRAALDDARGGPALITMEPGDPRRAAWLQHWRDTGDHEVAAVTERLRLPIDVEADWPPESESVGRIDYGNGRVVWIIQPDTPEWAAWVAHAELDGVAGKKVAQDMRMQRRTLQKHSLWPEIKKP